MNNPFAYLMFLALFRNGGFGFGGDGQCAIDYKAISENKHVGLAPTLDLTLIDWEFDKTVQKLRYDNVHPTAFGAARFAAVRREYIRQFVM